MRCSQGDCIKLKGKLWNLQMFYACHLQRFRVEIHCSQVEVALFEISTEFLASEIGMCNVPKKGLHVIDRVYLWVKFDGLA